MIKIALSLGGNIGDVPETFEFAIAKLAKAGVCEIRKSSLYHSDAEDCVKNTPPFTNSAITGNWDKSLNELFDLCQKIEQEAGRPKDHTTGTSRTLDIDIILFGDLIYKDGRLQIPHKEALLRFFVIYPLSEIAGDWTFPGKDAKISEILNKLHLKR
jgi:2-amino-4-hydroxy-6-hydroxymethyldihydropteridine diphosphokinase